MAYATHALGSAAAAPGLLIAPERLRRALLWFTAFAGAFVFMEPSPYEVVSVLALFVFAVTGLSLRPGLMPLALLLLLWNVGFSIAVIPLLDQSKPAIWVGVSWFMALTAVFFAAALTANTEQRLNALMRGYTAAALLASVCGILGYFRLVPYADFFLKYGRARGTFNDPNVLGAFLILPMLLALQRMMLGNVGQALRSGAVLMIMLIALLLSFSRGAWAYFAGTAALLMLLMLITSRSAKDRLRIIVLAALGTGALALFVVALLSVDQIATLFQERASLDQSYDTGHLGRFGRHLLGFQLALEKPFGIGPYQFATIFPEDPHNTFLNAFMTGGWISGLVYPLLVLLTLARGFRFLFVRTPWQPVYLAVYAAYLGVACESFIIDTDHWRHYFLLLGVLWGLMAASAASAARGNLAPARAAA
jgi:hypothetical protein